jgi:hypothetical protein
MRSTGLSRASWAVHRRTGRTAQSRTFRKHRRPCGQPAAVGELGRFRPVPPQTGHFERIKATPSDLPFKSTGFATYPVPPQFGQSSGFTPLSPLSVKKFLTDFRTKFAAVGFALRITNKKSIRGTRGVEGAPARRESTNHRGGDLLCLDWAEVGV